MMTEYEAKIVLSLAQSSIHYYRPHRFLSTLRGQAGILVRVHSVLRESLCRGDISAHDLGRIDKLLKVHISIPDHDMLLISH